MALKGLITLITIGVILMGTAKKQTAFNMEREMPIILKVAREYKLTPEDTVLLLSIRRAEAGPSGYEFGVKAAKGTDLETQAKWAAGSIRANRERYNRLMQEGQIKLGSRTIALPANTELVPGSAVVKSSLDFPEFMAHYGSPTGYGWAPIHDPKMPASEVKLNKNWAPNVRKFIGQYQKQLQGKGIGGQ